MLAKTSFAGYLLVLILLASIITSKAEPLISSGYFAVEARIFLEDPACKKQSENPAFSLVAQPELRYSSLDSRNQMKLTPFLRLDSVDDERSHFDIREAYWRYTVDEWRLLVGFNKVFWGVTESNHLVDIINQTDNLEDLDREKKLGQPTLIIGTDQDWGEMEVYFMPYFREQEFPGQKGRLRFPLPIGDDPLYESASEEYHLDVAFRYSHYFGNWDIGTYYFYGTSRDPLFLPSDNGKYLIPFYDIIHQVGLDLQYTQDAWLWKLETLFRDGSSNSLFGAVAGGFEYTLFQVFDGEADLGLLMEYNWDGRDEREDPPTLFDNDLFLGSRLTLNDPMDTTALIGAIIDIDNGSTLVSIETERRVGSSWRVELTGRFFINIDENDILSNFERDSFFNLSLQYHY